MKLSVLRKKVGKDQWGNDKLRYIFHPENILVCVWEGMLEPMKFSCEVTEAYKDACTRCGCEALANSSTDYRDGEGETVVVDLRKKSIGKWEEITVQSNKIGTTFFHDGNLLNLDDFLVTYARKGNYWFEEFIGTWKENVLVRMSDDIFMIAPDGIMEYVTCYPRPESGRDAHRKVSIEGDMLVVDEYVYYDNDHHHGGWESNSYQLSECEERIAEYRSKRAEYALAGLDYAKVDNAINAANSAFNKNNMFNEKSINIAVPGSKDIFVKASHTRYVRKVSIAGKNVGSIEELNDFIDSMIAESKVKYSVR